MVTILFPSNPPLKIEILSSTPFLKVWQETQHPRVHTMHFQFSLIGYPGMGLFTLLGHPHEPKI